MSVLKSDIAEIHSETDVVKIRQIVRSRAGEIRLSLVDQTKVVTAASEIARNTLIYGGGGRVKVEVLDEGMRRGMRLVFEDEGPGIADIQKALQDGFTTGAGLGLGLGGAKRLMNEFEIESEPGRGTRITMTKWN